VRDRFSVKHHSDWFLLRKRLFCYTHRQLEYARPDFKPLHSVDATAVKWCNSCWSGCKDRRWYWNKRRKTIIDLYWSRMYCWETCL